MGYRSKMYQRSFLCLGDFFEMGNKEGQVKKFSGKCIARIMEKDFIILGGNTSAV